MQEQETTSNTVEQVLNNLSVMIKLTNSVHFRTKPVHGQLSQQELEYIKQHEITNVLTLLASEREEENEPIKHTIISYSSVVSDTSQSVTEFFEKCNSFFVDAFSQKKEEQPFGILVRTDYELDMSPCVLAFAYYLVEEKHLSVEKSIQFIQSKIGIPDDTSVHNWLSPIFVEQLRFHINDKKRQEIQHNVEVQQEEAKLNAEYFCQMCRHKLFSHRDLMEHASERRGMKDFSYKKLKKDLRKGLSKSTKQCTSLYLAEKMDWMGNMDGDEGRLTCPQCQHRVGTYKWSGNQCSCGVWVCPSLQVQMSRVDRRQ